MRRLLALVFAGLLVGAPVALAKWQSVLQVSVSSGGGGSPPALDGVGDTNGGISTGSSFTVTTTQANDLIILAITWNPNGVPGLAISGGLTWTCRTNSDIGGGANCNTGTGNQIQEFCAPAATSGSHTSTITGTWTYLEAFAFGVSGSTGSCSTGFDTNASFPAEAGSGALTVSTSNANDMVWGVARDGTPGSPPATWTNIDNNANMFSQGYYKTFTSTQSGLSIPDISGVNNGIIGDAAQN
jgi:hypothetical protein